MKKIICFIFNFLVYAKNYLFFNNYVIGYYNLSRDIFSLNFYDFLQKMELERIKKNKEKILLKVIDPKNNFLELNNYKSINSDTKKGFYFSNRYLFFNLCIPLLKNFNNVDFFVGDSFLERYVVKDKLNTYIYSIYDDFDNFLENKKIEKKLIFIEDTELKIIQNILSYKALNQEKIITITLRNAPQDKNFNSDIKKMIELYDFIKSHGWSPVFVQDIQGIYRIGNNIEIEHASVNPNIRTALYKISKLNIAIGKGFAKQIIDINNNWILINSRKANDPRYSKSKLFENLYSSENKFKKVIDNFDLELLKKMFLDFLESNQK